MSLSKEKNNRLIAQFIGMQKTDLGWYDNKELLSLNTNDNTFDNLEFHTSWNWLMPVINKCRSESYLMIKKPYLMDHINHHLTFCDIDDTYRSVINFIKVFNKDKKIECV